MSSNEDLPVDVRNTDLYLHIDPGFINRRKCYSVFGNAFVNEYEGRKRPGNEWPDSLFNDHLIVDLAMRHCKDKEVLTLGEVLGAPSVGQLFCSTECLDGTKDVYSQLRVSNRIKFRHDEEREVFLEFSTTHFVSDTGKFEQSVPSELVILGQVRRVEQNAIAIHPLIMGGITADHSRNHELSKRMDVDLTWQSTDWYQAFPDQIDEFTAIRNIEDPSPSEWMPYMKCLQESDLKWKICEILNDIAKKDWGGEFNDHFTTSLHLSGRRIAAAFLLKGPTNFREMTPELLGKRGDQIYRLACTPASLLVVQHSHLIGEAVRSTLEAFAVRPHSPRRYCLIDGKDTFKILKAYGKL